LKNLFPSQPQLGDYGSGDTPPPQPFFPKAGNADLGHATDFNYTLDFPRERATLRHVQCPFTRLIPNGSKRRNAGRRVHGALAQWCRLVP
jgi:hypothetical protein